MSHGLEERRIMPEEHKAGNMQFFGREVSPLLLDAVKTLKRSSRCGGVTVLDLGMGDGAVIRALLGAGCIGTLDRIVGIDIDRERCLTAAGAVGEGHFVAGDAVALPLGDSSVDLVNAWMVIEHVRDDAAMVREAYRVLRDGGRLTLSTVVRRRWGFYIYRRDGRFVLDPTHVREYGATDEFLTLLRDNGFRVRDTACRTARYSILELGLRVLVRLRLARAAGVRGLCPGNRGMNALSRLLRIPVPGFYEVEASCRKAGGSGGGEAG